MSDEFVYDGTRKCDDRLFHAKVVHEIFSRPNVIKERINKKSFCY